MKTKYDIHLAAIELAQSTLELTDNREIDQAIQGGSDLTGKDYDYFKQEFMNARTRYLQLKLQPAPSSPPPARAVPAGPKPTNPTATE